MVDIFSSILLGCIQGLTEFLPVSSSGHLVLFQHLFGFKEPVLLFDIALHLGTLVAVCVYFFTDLQAMFRESPGLLWALAHRDLRPQALSGRPHGALALWVVVATIPTGLIGFFLRGPLEQLFGSLRIVGCMMIVTGMILFITHLLPIHYNRGKKIGFWTALAIGLSQGIAIIPGISRSGTTIACGLFCKIQKDQAARFSFLLSIPAILGAVVLKFDPAQIVHIGVWPLAIGFGTALAVGLLVLRFLMFIVRRGQLHYFSPYCWLAGLTAIVLSFL